MDEDIAGAFKAPLVQGIDDGKDLGTTLMPYWDNQPSSWSAQLVFESLGNLRGCCSYVDGVEWGEAFKTQPSVAAVQGDFFVIERVGEDSAGRMKACLNQVQIAIDSHDLGFLLTEIFGEKIQSEGQVS